MQKPGPEESFDPRAATKSGHNLRSQTLRLARGVGGQGIAEFVFAIPVFMTLVFGMYEFSRYYSTRLMIRSAVAEGARFATTGNQLVDPVTGDPLPRAVSIVNTILNRTAHFGVTAGDITLDPADGGGPGRDRDGEPQLRLSRGDSPHAEHFRHGCLGLRCCDGDAK